MNKENNALSPMALAPKIDMAHVNNCMSIPYPESLNFIGQNRAQTAIDFALGMEMPGYNLYVMGEAALGRFSIVNDKLTQHSKTRKTPLEWLYVNNYDDHREPISICLQPGEGKVFCDDIDSLIDEIMDTFPAAFDSLSTGSPGALILIINAIREIAISIGIKVKTLFMVYFNILNYSIVEILFLYSRFNFKLFRITEGLSINMLLFLN